MNHHKYAQMIFDKDAKNIQWIKDNFFQQIILGKMDIHIPEKNKLDHYLTLYTKIDQKK